MLAFTFALCWVAAVAAGCTNVSAVVDGSAPVFLLHDTALPAATTTRYSVCGLGVHFSAVSATATTGTGATAFTRWRAVSDDCWEASIATAAAATTAFNITFRPPTNFSTRAVAQICEEGQYSHSGDIHTTETPGFHTYVVTVCSPTVLHRRLAATAEQCVPSDGRKRAWLVSVIDDTWSGMDDACAHIGMSMHEDAWLVSSWVSCLESRGIIVRAMSDNALASGERRAVKKKARTAAATDSEMAVISLVCGVPLIYILRAVWDRVSK